MNRESTPAPSHAPNPQAAAFVITACAVTALLVFFVYVENFFFGSIYGIWMYRYFEEKTPIPRWIPLAVLVLLALSVFGVKRLIDKREKTALFAGFLNSVLIQSVLRLAYPFSLGAVVASDRSNSFYTPAAQYSALEILTNFDRLARSFPLHARSNMPGKVLLFEFLGVFTSSPEVMGYLVIVISSLGGLFLYAICKRLFNDRTTAFYALTLYSLVPCKLFFLPLLNTVTPVFMLLVFLLFLVYLENRSAAAASFLGFAVYFTFMFEPSPLVTGILFAFILLYSLRDKKLPPRDLLRLFLYPLLAFAAAHLFFKLVFSFDLVRTFQFVLGDAADFNSAANRDYRIWFGENIKEFFYGVGTPVMVIFIQMLAVMAIHWRKYIKISQWSPEDVFLTGLLATFAFVTLLGINRGEILRLWIYLAVLFQVPASIYLAKIEKGEGWFFLAAGTIMIQALLPLHRVAFVVP